MRELAPGRARVPLLYSARTLRERAAADARSLGAGAQAGVSFARARPGGCVDADVVAAARGGAASRLGVWTVNERDAIRRVIDLGVDVVISDRPDLAQRAARPLTR